jgi:hypothetical protein
MDKEEFYEGAEDRLLAVFPQQRYHHNAYIIGGRKGLLALRAAIDEALNGDWNPANMGCKVGMALAHPGDDEVNATYVILDDGFDMQEEGRGTSDDIPLPYYDPRCQEQLREGAVNLAPGEQHIMAAGVHAYLVKKRFDEGVTRPDLEPKAQGNGEAEAHPS